MLLAALTAGIIADLKLALVFGVTVFSGAGCISIAATLKRKFYAVSLVYLAVAVLSLLTAAFAEIMRSALFPHFYLFSALLLITLGLEFLGISAGIRPGEVVKVGFAIALIYSLLHIPNEVNIGIEHRMLLPVLLSVMAGFFSTLLGGILFNRYSNPKVLRRISGLILVILGIRILRLGVV